jgi:hypothetical protein
MTAQFWCLSAKMYLFARSVSEKITTTTTTTTITLAQSASHSLLLLHWLCYLDNTRIMPAQFWHLSAKMYLFARSVSEKVTTTPVLAQSASHPYLLHWLCYLDNTRVMSAQFWDLSAKISSRDQ